LHDILKRERTAIGDGGRLVETHNLPNNRIVDNQYRKLVDQKANYLCGQPITFSSENAAYADALTATLGRSFRKTLLSVARDCLNGGLGWLYVSYGENGDLCFKSFPPYDILPFWKDFDHTELDRAVRLFEVGVYDGEIEKTEERVEIYSTDGIERFALQNSILIADVENPKTPYLCYSDAEGESHYSWGESPLVAFKRNSLETPLICGCKSLQDAISATLSDFQNNMQEDYRNTILVIKNYDGTNLAEFRRNLALFGTVKVQTVDGSEGAMDALKVEVNAENYRVFLELAKKALIENALGFDAKDDRLNGTPNQMNIKSMYSDVDLDASGMELEFQAAFDRLLMFVNVYLANAGLGRFDGETAEVIFNRDMLMSETDIINGIRLSEGLLSRKTLVANHPWVTDIEAELKRIEDEADAADPYASAWRRDGS
jgi:SPP1 family phage portal protein